MLATLSCLVASGAIVWLILAAMATRQQWWAAWKRRHARAAYYARHYDKRHQGDG